MADRKCLNYRRIANDKARYRAALADIQSKTVDSSVIRRLRDAVIDEYGDEFADAVVQTLIQYTGEKLSARTISLLCNQLGGRYYQLERGPLEKFNILNIREEWVPLEVLGLQQAVWRETKPGVQLQLECIAGTPAGHILDRKLPLGWLSYLAYQIGFTRRMEYPDDQPWLFEGLRFWGCMVKLEDKAELDFVDFAVDSNMRKANKEILKLRLRYDLDGDTECPFEFGHECSSCQKKHYECPAAPRHALPLAQMAAIQSAP